MHISIISFQIGFRCVSLSITNLIPNSLSRSLPSHDLQVTTTAWSCIAIP